MMVLGIIVIVLAIALQSTLVGIIGGLMVTIDIAADVWKAGS